MTMDELFAEAVERLKAGESTASIVASFPVDAQAEINDLLAIVELTDQVAVQPLPQRTTRQRSLARAQFLQQTAAIRAEMEETLGAETLVPAQAALSTQKRTEQPGWWERLSMAWGSLFDTPLLRLAPLAIIIIAVYLATFWTVRTAQAALPGDAAYPIKQWMREQRLSLAPADQRIKIITDNEKEVAEEAQKLAADQENRMNARAALSTENTEPMVYYGNKGDLMMIGPFLVAPNYQPVAGVEDFKTMEIQGALVPGAVVQLTYKLLPGNPSVVQGVRAVVVDSPKPAPTPTSAPERAVGCQRILPDSWVPYPVRPGDNLSRLAYRTGASVIRIMDVNCLETASLLGVSQIYLPQRVYVRVTPPVIPPPPTLPPPPATLVPPATVIPELTATPMPPTTQPDQPTPVATEEVTEPPSGDATVPATAAPTTEPGTTPAATPTDVPVQIPGGTPSASPTALPTGSVTEMPTGVPSGVPTDMPIGTVTATTEPGATAVPTEQVTARTCRHGRSRRGSARRHGASPRPPWRPRRTRGRTERPFGGRRRPARGRCPRPTRRTPPGSPRRRPAPGCRRRRGHAWSRSSRRGTAGSGRDRRTRG